MHIDDITKILAGLGFGAGTGATLTAILNANSMRGKSRAEAADLLIGAAERVGKMNAEQDEEIKQLKTKLDTIQHAMLAYLSEDITRAELLEITKELR